jgi:hypothetical protein
MPRHLFLWLLEGVVKIMVLENLSKGEHKEDAAVYEVGGCYKQKQKA